MNAEEVRNMNWVPVSNWNRLTTLCCDYRVDSFVGKSDIERFIDDLIDDIAWELDIPYTTLGSIIKENNKEFYEKQNELFKRRKSISKTDPKMLELKSLLRVPDIGQAKVETNNSNVEEVLAAFAALNDLEKLEVLQRLGAATVEVQFPTK